MAQSNEESDAHKAVANAEQVKTIRVSPRDFTRILDLLENPPSPTDKLKAAIAALPDSQ